MKKSLILIFIICLSVSSFAQVQTWRPNYVKNNFRDSTLFVKDVNMTGPLRVSGTFKIGAVTITTNGTEINLLDGLLATTAELNTLVGTTSNIQSQINAKAPITNPGLIGIARLNTDTLATKAYVRSYGGGGAAIWGSITGTLSGQTDLNNALAAKAPIANPVFTGIPRLSTDTLATKPQVRTEINDTITARLAVATELSSVAVMKTDLGVTVARMSDITGVGGSTLYNIEFRVDEAGAPAAGDSIFTSTSLAGKHVMVYREGSRLGTNFTPTNLDDGFRYNVETGTMVFNPVLAANEEIIIDALDPINVERITPVDALPTPDFYADFELISGVAVYSAVDDAYLGDTDGTINQTGKLSRAIGLNGTQTALALDGDYDDGFSTAFSITAWVYMSTLPTGATGSYIYANNNSVAPWTPTSLYIKTADNKLSFTVRNSADSEYSLSSTSALVAETWYFIVATCNGTSSPMKLYVDGVDVSASSVTPTGTLVNGDSGASVGNRYISDTNGVIGLMDDFAAYPGALTQAQINYLYNLGNGRTYE